MSTFTSHTHFFNPDEIQMLGSSLKSCTWDSELIHTRAREIWRVRESACIIVLFGSLPLGERVPVQISGIKKEPSLKLHFGQNMQNSRPVAKLTQLPCILAKHLESLERILPSRMTIPVKGTLCKLRNQWKMFPEKQGLVSTMSMTWSVGTLLFMEARQTFVCRSLFFESSHFRIMHHLFGLMTF